MHPAPGESLSLDPDVAIIVASADGKTLTANFADRMIANVDGGETGLWLKLTARRDGTFTVVNARNGASRTYRRSIRREGSAGSSNPGSLPGCVRAGRDGPLADTARQHRGQRVIDQPSLRALYQRIGDGDAFSPMRYDSRAARNAGRQIALELRPGRVFARRPSRGTRVHASPRDGDE